MNECTVRAWNVQANNVTQTQSVIQNTCFIYINHLASCQQQQNITSLALLSKESLSCDMAARGGSGYWFAAGWLTGRYASIMDGPIQLDHHHHRRRRGQS